MADVSLYAQRFWRNSALLRELDKTGGDAEEVQDCINELTANALHAPTADLRRRSQAVIDTYYARHAHDLQNVRGI